MLIKKKKNKVLIKREKNQLNLKVGCDYKTGEEIIISESGFISKFFNNRNNRIGKDKFCYVSFYRTINKV